jgi:hypothetical protein
MPVVRYKFQQDHAYKSLLWQNHVGTPTFVVKKQYLNKVGGFTPTMPRYQDWDLALKIAKVTSISHLNEPYLLSYVTKGSITQNKEANLLALELLYETNFEAINNDKKLKARWAYKIGDAQMSTNVKRARKHLFEALMLHPLKVKYLVAYIISMLGSSNVYDIIKKTVTKYVYAGQAL